MRVSTSAQYDAGIANLQQRQGALADAQDRLTSGLRVRRASDDPAAAARAERALATQRRSEADQRAVENARSVMTLTEGALAEAGELLQSARETVMAAGNGSYGDAERAALAQALRGARQQLLSVANRSDGAGGYLFAGQGASQPPFSDAPGGVRFDGVSGSLVGAAGPSLPLTGDGEAIWLRAPSGNGVIETQVLQQNGSAWIDAGRVSDPSALGTTPVEIRFSVAGGVSTYSIFDNGAPTAVANVPYVSGRDIEYAGATVNVRGVPADGDRFGVVPSTPSLSVFDALDRAIADLGTAGRSSGQVAQTVNVALRDLDAVMTRMQYARSAAGSALKLADDEAERLGELELSARTERSNAQDLDMVQALSEFQSQQTGYDAALRTYASVQRMSLFQYIGR
jgi:flagellar hook-associated protein 3 FlgL